MTSLTNTLIAATLVLAVPLIVEAQEKTKDGIALSWTHRIEVQEAQLKNGVHTLPAYTITVHESDGSWVMDQWKNEMKAISESTTGAKPVRVTSARIPAMGDTPLLLLANSETDRKAKAGILTVAFALNDSTAAPGDPTQVMHDLAVKLNKAVVQEQIDAREKMLGKADDKRSSAQATEAKTAKNINKANSDLDKSKKRLAKLQGDKARLQGEVHGQEKKFAMTNDPKDLKRLTKARQRLTKNESATAKEMEREAKIQATLSKHQKSQARASDTLQDRTESKEEIQRIISELKRKQDAIR